MLSLRKSINAKCRDCIYDPLGGGTWRAQVAQCSAIRCPLWPVRPASLEGKFRNPPRDPATVHREWVTAPQGEAITGLLTGERPEAMRG